MRCFLVHFQYFGGITFSPKVNQTLVHLEVNQDPRFQVDRLVRTRVRMSFHTTPNKPDYPKERSRVQLKRTDMFRSESTLMKVNAFSMCVRPCTHNGSW